jgi:hypothetical protein
MILTNSSKKKSTSMHIACKEQEIKILFAIKSNFIINQKQMYIFKACKTFGARLSFHIVTLTSIFT